MKINSIIKVEKKRIPEIYGGEYAERRIAHSFNQALDLIGNKEIGLDVGKMEDFLDGYKFPIMAETNEYGDSDEITKEEFIQALKAQEKSIIVEKREV